MAWLYELNGICLKILWTWTIILLAYYMMFYNRTSLPTTISTIKKERSSSTSSSLYELYELANQTTWIAEKQYFTQRQFELNNPTNDIFRSYAANYPCFWGESFVWNNKSPGWNRNLPMDGGKWVCGIQFLQKPCIVYSFGCDHNYLFEYGYGLAEKCKIYTFDPFNRSQPSKSDMEKLELLPNFKFFPWGLSDINDDEKHMYRLSKIMWLLNHTHIDILKIDIEGWEFPVFHSLDKLNEWPSIGQIQIEIHVRINNTSIDIRKQRLGNIIKLFEKHNFRIFHVEPNAAIQDDLAEYALIQKDWRPHIKNYIRVVKRQSKYFTRVIDNKYAIFCSLPKGDGIGNILSVYWTARALAYWMNWIFVMNENTNTMTKVLDISCEYPKEYKIFDRQYRHQMQWTWFLSYEYNETFSNINIPSSNNSLIASKYKYIWQAYDSGAPHRTYLMFIAYNAWFIPIIQNNTRHAFQRYYSYDKNNSIPISKWDYSMDSHKSEFYESWMKELGNKNINNIVIHIRMGDVLLARYKHMLKMKYFSIALDMIFTDIKLNDNFNRVYKFRIISQLSDVNAHNQNDIKALNMSNRIVYFMVDQIDNYIASKYDIKYSLEVIGNDTSDNDYFKMITVPYLICSPSTFCFHAAMANFYDPKLIIMTEIGAWIRHRKSYRNVSESAKSGLLTHHKWIDTRSMAQKAKYALNGTQPAPNDFSVFTQWFMS